MFPYAACKTDELTFAAGQIIELITVGDEGWWEGRIGDQFGWFPSNYAQEFEGEPPKLASPEGTFIDDCLWFA